MKNNVLQSVSRTFHKVGFRLRNKSPEILVVAGIIGVVASTVMACRETTKAGEIAETAKNMIEEIHEAEANGVTRAGKEYTKEDTRNDLYIVYVQTGVKYARLYAPAIIMGVASISCILASHRMLKKRNAALAAAYMAVDKSFKEYRSRVLERFGEQVEKELRYNIRAKETEKTVVDDRGEEQKVKEVTNIAAKGWDPSQYSPYARVFDETNPQWNKNAEMNTFYLKARQSQATDMLRSRGHLFLNEVYDMLGFPRTKAGAVVGWLYDPKHPELGDTYVDFGIYEVQREKAADFDSGWDRSVILDFNVVGDITDEIDNHQFI